MAEVVELRVERGIEELLQLERVGLFVSAEVKTIIKKRKAFEYKLQKAKKCKEDYLKYIAYEQSLLRLIKVRRKRIGYSHKYKEIDNTIANRISQIFRAVIYKHQGDVQLWFSFINFCKKMEWKGSVGSLYTRMLQVHSNNEALWVAAAKWEFEGNQAQEAARGLLQRGLRHLPQSRALWLEYIRMELMFADKVRKRRQILLGHGNSASKEENSGEGLAVKGDDDANNDAILSGKIAQLAYDKGASAAKDISFPLSCLPVLDQFDGALVNPLKDYIYDDIQANYSNCEEAWNALAKREILRRKTSMDETGDSSSLTKKESLAKAIEVYDNAIETIRTEKMFTLYIKFVLELLSRAKNAPRRSLALERVFNLMNAAWDENLLSSEMFREMLLLLKSLIEETGGSSAEYDIKLSSLICTGTDRWATKPEIWLFCLTILTQMKSVTKMEVKRMFDRALQKMNTPMSQFKPSEGEDAIEDYVNVWRLYAEWAQVHLPAKEVMKLVENVVNGSTLPVGTVVGKMLCLFCKPLLLELSIELFESDGVDRARFLYNKYKDYYPSCKEFCSKMIEIEMCEDNSSYDYKFTSSLFKDLTRTFGQDDHSLWLEYARFELEKGKAENVGKIYSQATKVLSAEECGHFTSIYSLMQKNM